MTIINFTKKNPYSKYFTHGKLNRAGTAIGFYNGLTYCTAEPYDRYLTSVSMGRLLTLAEYDAELINREKNKTPALDVLSDYLSPMKTTIKPKKLTWKTLGKFEYQYSKIKLIAREDEKLYRVIDYSRRKDEMIFDGTATHPFDNLSEAKETFQNGVSNIIYYTSFTDLSLFMQQG